MSHYIPTEEELFKLLDETKPTNGEKYSSPTNGEYIKKRNERSQTILTAGVIAKEIFIRNFKFPEGSLSNKRCIDVAIEFLETLHAWMDEEQTKFEAEHKEKTK